MGVGYTAQVEEVAMGSREHEPDSRSPQEKGGPQPEPPIAPWLDIRLARGAEQDGMAVGWISSELSRD
jgi:hypothetical protein